MDSILEKLGKRYMLSILKLMKKRNRPMKFSEIQEGLGAAGTISRRLRELCNLNLISKETHPEEIGRPTYYVLTEKGMELLDLLEKIEEWASENLS